MNIDMQWTTWSSLMLAVKRALRTVWFYPVTSCHPRSNDTRREPPNRHCVNTLFASTSLCQHINKLRKQPFQVSKPSFTFDMIV